MEKTAQQEEEAKNIKRVFDMFDVNHDGTVSTEEFGQVLKSLGHDYSVDELKDMVTSADADGSGTIDLAEFTKLILRQNENLKVSEQLAEAFSVFDREGNGYISSAELKYALRTVCSDVSEQEANEIVLAGDSNGDGLISYEEFVHMLTPAV